MRRYISLLLFIGLAWGQITTIAVLEFEGKGVSQSETSTLTDRLRDEMFKTGIYIVLERGKMDEVLKEQGFQQTGCISSECAVEVGNMLGVQQMVAGSIGKVGTVYTVSARIFDVQTGKILKSANYDHIGDIGQLLLKGMREVVNQFVKRKPPIIQMENITESSLTNSPKTNNIIIVENSKKIDKKETIPKKIFHKTSKFSKFGLSFILIFLIGVIRVVIGV
jgi:TolB-like protein